MRRIEDLSRLRSLSDNFCYYQLFKLVKDLSLLKNYLVFYLI